ncbi:cyclic nucleotide-binding domain-containing protein [Phenylobacterium sp.]|uniref:transcriptional activator FtrB n=1 Tax=Phenylobacterium sp. TaxID=1871053 RepID=UPI0025E46965|nr:cyclic nucleotide-binding domain-containing protein [Phenylobacterium sp.]MBX3485866.1 cyclic nucleotide-binding domain-containing protein [Phenylobacterium sp.]MCW5758789.1 cyclic nucleotide-binding domain-containing protein [Phenylobacterium sp.]
MRDVDLERVRALPLFSDCSDDTFRTLTAGAFLQRFPAGTTLLLEGDPVDFLYVLLDGVVELEGTWNDKETTLAILRPVSTFILAAVVLDADGLMSARTVERSDILMLSGAAMRRVMSEDARFAVAVAQEMAGCYRGLVRSLKNQKLRGGLERLANYLITQRLRQGGEPTFALPTEKRMLASLLGMTPENLSRSLAALADYGVEVNGPSVTITRPAVLERLAKPDPLIDNHQPVSGGVTGKAQRERWPQGDDRTHAA